LAGPFLCDSPEGAEAYLVLTLTAFGAFVTVAVLFTASHGQA